MTDIANRPLSDAQLDAIAALDTNLGDDTSLLKADNADLRRRLAAAELRAVNAVAAEDTAQFAFETAGRRANRFEAAFKKSLMKDLKATVPESLENSVEALADFLVDEIATGTDYDDLDVAGHVESWLEEQ
jgi:hypothetical protein